MGMPGRPIDPSMLNNETAVYDKIAPRATVELFIDLFGPYSTE